MSKVVQRFLSMPPLFVSVFLTHPGLVRRRRRTQIWWSIYMQNFFLAIIYLTCTGLFVATDWLQPRRSKNLPRICTSIKHSTTLIPYEYSFKSLWVHCLMRTYSIAIHQIYIWVIPPQMNALRYGPTPQPRGRAHLPYQFILRNHCIWRLCRWQRTAEWAPGS